MNSPESVVIALDGEAKCGKSTIADSIALAAHDLAPVASEHSFSAITTTSAGSVFRSAAYYVRELRRSGITKTSFDDTDYVPIQEISTNPECADELQEDKEIERSVAEVAKLPGAQNLCGAIFSDSIFEAYGAGHLVVTDGRNPVKWMLQNKLVGEEPGRIRPAGILSIYIETPPDVAARRMGSDFATNLSEVMRRRGLDKNRKENPVTRPCDLMTEYDDWREQFDEPRPGELALPYRFDNGHSSSMPGVENFARRIARVAYDLGVTLSSRAAQLATDSL